MVMRWSLNIKTKGNTMQFSVMMVCMLYHEGRSPAYIAKYLKTSEDRVDAILQAHYTGETPCPQ
jgi:hypothetical protein